MMYPKTLSDPGLYRNRNPRRNFDYSFSDKSDWLSWNAAFETPAKDPVHHDRVKPLRQHPADYLPRTASGLGQPQKVCFECSPKLRFRIDSHRGELDLSHLLDITLKASFGQCPETGMDHVELLPISRRLRLSGKWSALGLDRGLRQ